MDDEHYYKIIFILFVIKSSFEIFVERSIHLNPYKELTSIIESSLIFIELQSIKLRASLIFFRVKALSNLFYTYLYATVLKYDSLLKLILFSSSSIPTATTNYRDISELG